MEFLTDLGRVIKLSSFDVLLATHSPVRGHDFVDLLTLAFRKTWGSCSALDVTRERLELSLRLAYSENDFVNTHLFSQVRAWSTDHPPFKVFSDPRQTILSV